MHIFIAATVNFFVRVRVNEAYGLVNYIFPVKYAAPLLLAECSLHQQPPPVGLLYSTSRSGGAKSFHFSCVGSRGAGGRHAL
jgi:hypothetical protein